jgi:hypothetical protein
MKYTKYIKNFKLFKENDSGTANATATISGSGDISNPQPSNLPGVPGTEGSGDVSFYLLKKNKKTKKGKPNEVSDLRFLEPAKNVTKIKEGIVYDKIEDYIHEIKLKLSDYNIRPIVLSQILDKYEYVINKYYDNAIPASDMIIKDFELDSGGFNSLISFKDYNTNLKYL